MARKLNFPDVILANGEATGMAGGFKGQDVNGSLRYEGLGWNQNYDWSNMPAVEKPTWKRGSNRSGE